MPRGVLVASRDLVASILTPGEARTVRVVSGLPPGARLIGASLTRLGDLELAFEHESFTEGETLSVSASTE